MPSGAGVVLAVVFAAGYLSLPAVWRRYVRRRNR